MNISGVRTDDIVRCDVKGRRFHARVEGVPVEGALAVEPLERGITYRAVTARQVIEHWRKAGRPRPNHKVAG